MNQYSYQTPFKKRSTASELRERARGILGGHWGLAIGVFLLASILGLSSGLNVSLTEQSDLSGEEIAERVARFLQSNSVEVMRAEILRVAATMLSGIAIIGSIFSLAFSIFVGAPIKLGYAKFNLDLADRKSDVGVSKLFYAFENCYWRAIGVVILKSLAVTAVTLPIMAIPFVAAVCMLWGMELTTVGILSVVLITASLFVVCGIIAVLLGISVELRYSMSLYIALEYPTLGVFDVLKNSAILMKGNKMRLFCLQFSFIGWILLSALTFGIGMIWVSPYMMAAQTAFYDEISGRATAKEVEFPSLDPEDYFSNEF